MASGRALGALGIAGENEAEDLLVLGPDQRALLGIIEHGAHRAFQMRPLRRDGVFDRAIAGQTIECGVEGDIGLNERQHRSIRTEREAGGKRPLRCCTSITRPAMRSAASRAASASSAVRTW